MQTTNMLRTTAPVSSSRMCCNRANFQAKLAPSVRRGRMALIRAEADNTGGSITNSGQTKGKDSYEVRTAQDHMHLFVPYIHDMYLYVLLLHCSTPALGM